MSKENNAFDGADLTAGLLAAASKAAGEEVVETEKTETVKPAEDKKTEEEPKVEEKPEEPTEDKEEEDEEEVEEVEEPEGTDTEQLAKWKALSRKNETKLKSTLNKNQELEKKVQALELEKVKYEVAMAKGFTADDLILLEGSTKEAIEAKAEALAKKFGGSNKPTAESTFGFNPLMGSVNTMTERPKDNSPAGLLGSILADFDNQ